MAEKERKDNPIEWTKEDAPEAKTPAEAKKEAEQARSVVDKLIEQNKKTKKKDDQNE